MYIISDMEEKSLYRWISFEKEWRKYVKKRKDFQKRSIQEQLQIILAIAVLLFLLLCAAISMSTRKVIAENADEHTRITAIRLRDQMSFNYDKIQNYCISIGEDESIRALLSSEFSEISGHVSKAKECMTHYKILEPTIEDISLVNEKVHYSSVYSYETLDLLRKQMKNQSFQWIGVKKHEFVSASQKPDLMVYAGNVMVNGNDIGTILISLNVSSLQLEEESAMNSAYLLAGEDGTVYPFNCSEKTAKRVWEKWKNNRTSYLHAMYLDEMKVWLLSSLNTKQRMTGASQIFFLTWGCVFLAVVFCTALFILVNGSVVKPLRQFYDTIRQIRTSHQRKLKEELQLGGCSEFTEIGREFAGMLKDIETMNKQIFQSATDLYEAKVQKQTAELAYLRSQIDPHFLYNTLEVVRKMALEKNAPQIAQMAVDMGSIFRYSTKGSDEVCLSDEIAIIESYIRIQQMRFQEKIEVYYFISEDVKNLRVFKMLLQPIVENAIFHGLEPKQGEGSLFVGARREENDLVITITDDGVGIPEERLTELRKDLEREDVDTRKHVGVLNTNARIRLQYGKAYGLTLESCEMDGTTVMMRLPAREQ